jgi:hypothetical protein
MSNSLAAGAVNQSERRHSHRFLCDFDIAIEWGAANLRGVVRDISIDGLFVELPEPLWIGARFAAQMALDKPVSLDCVVRRVEPRRGMAVSFVAAQESGRATISSLLQRLAEG